MFNYISYYNLEVQRIRLKLSISIEFFSHVLIYHIFECTPFIIGLDPIIHFNESQYDNNNTNFVIILISI